MTSEAAGAAESSGRTKSDATATLPVAAESAEPRPSPTSSTRPASSEPTQPSAKPAAPQPQTQNQTARQSNPQGQESQAAKQPASGGVLNGRAVSLPRPEYPETARRMRVAGTVSVEVTIDVDGKVISARAISGPTALRNAAVAAARQARFSPTLISGKPTQVTGFINYNFSL